MGYKKTNYESITPPTVKVTLERLFDLKRNQHYYRLASQYAEVERASAEEILQELFRANDDGRGQRIDFVIKK